MKTPFKLTGELLRGFRIDKKMSQGDLSEALDIHIQYVSNWERGTCMPPKHCLKRLAAALGIRARDKSNIKLALISDISIQIVDEYSGII